ncbi:SUKH-4 family immunity protein [Streptomyces bobili]|uniref:SUKH-4 family immunity protein n=1 Tax=Streptomyces bobili TaxID=67280 RepID=UPI0036EEA178
MPLVQDVVDAEDFEDASEDAGERPVIGWLLNAHLALGTGSGKVYAFDADEETVQELWPKIVGPMRTVPRIVQRVSPG